MTNVRLDRLAWALIYGGLGLAALGWILSDDAALHGGTMVVLGLAAAATGVVLIRVRSRRTDDGTTEGR